MSRAQCLNVRVSLIDSVGSTDDLQLDLAGCQACTRGEHLDNTRHKLFFHQNLTAISRLQSSSPVTSYFKRSAAVLRREQTVEWLVHSDGTRV